MSTIIKHIQINLQGLIQGVGFRPFIYRLARQYQQNGWIANSESGVVIELEGEAVKQQDLISAMHKQLPPYAVIKSIKVKNLPISGYRGFSLKSSITGPNKSSFVLPDIATCQACVSELFDTDSRFYRYPFISCCHCGPRYSLMTAQPYDRSRTSMASFALCPSCLNEYRDPDNRRFHAQTLACEDCGPQLQLLDDQGALIAELDQALNLAVRALRQGKIVALKGIGGYQLLVDANNASAVAELRMRKNRAQKPFAIMMSSVDAAEHYCVISEQERQSLTSAAAPIVLLQRRHTSDAFESIAPGIALLGVMLPYSPLHHLLLNDFGGPVIASSGNRHHEPICINQTQALNQLQGIADCFLTHDREILRPLDDSIVRMIGSKITVMRRARGYVPEPAAMKQTMPDGVALGGHLKHTLAISRGNQVIISQHLGDMESLAAREQFQSTLKDMLDFFQVQPEQVMYDSHPGYYSSQYAAAMAIPAVPVQHHYAHILACMAEQGLRPPLLGIAWDGSGYGTEDELWGGEFLLIHDQGFERVAHFRSFCLPGGAKAIQEPRRAALGALYELLGESVFKLKHNPCLNAFSSHELKILQTAIQKRLNMPLTSSVGRCFDAVASLSGLCQINCYEGEAAMRLETAAGAVDSDLCYPFTLSGGQPRVIDWHLMLTAILHDYSSGQQALIPIKFHNTLAEIALAIAREVQQDHVVISGGCFQNACLVTLLQQRLEVNGFKLFQQQRIPPNDGGLALGQLVAAQYLKRS